jgi:hypothetical protein
MLSVVPDPVNVPEIVTLVCCDAKAKDWVMMAVPSGVVALAEVATSTVGTTMRAINNRRVLPIITPPSTTDIR